MSRTTQREIELEIMWLKEKLRTLAGELYANEQMGFDDYAQDVREQMERVRNQVRELETKRR